MTDETAHDIHYAFHLNVRMFRPLRKFWNTSVHIPNCRTILSELSAPFAPRARAANAESTIGTFNTRLKLRAIFSLPPYINYQENYAIGEATRISNL